MPKERNFLANPYDLMTVPQLSYVPLYGSLCPVLSVLHVCWQMPRPMSAWLSLWRRPWTSRRPRWRPRIRCYRAGRNTSNRCRQVSTHGSDSDSVGELVSQWCCRKLTHFEIWISLSVLKGQMSLITLLGNEWKSCLGCLTSTCTSVYILLH